VPVITGVLGTIKKGIVQNVQLLPDHPSAIELQKVTLMSTAHNVRNRFGHCLRPGLTRRTPSNN
jgi:hypothetical protein